MPSGAAWADMEAFRAGRPILFCVMVSEELTVRGERRVGPSPDVSGGTWLVLSQVRQFPPLRDVFRGSRVS